MDVKIWKLMSKMEKELHQKRLELHYGTTQDQDGIEKEDIEPNKVLHRMRTSTLKESHPFRCCSEILMMITDAITPQVRS
jgi:hypothetical protein